MNVDRLQMAPGENGANALGGARVPAGLRRIAIVAVALMLAACGRRMRERSDAPEPAPTAQARAAAGIEPIWKEPDRLARAHLEGYGWVDRAAGIVHIPIDRAMNLVLAGQKSSGPPPVPMPEAARAEETDTAAQRAGRRLFRQYGCSVCHDPDAIHHAPSLVGIYGQRVRLSDGTFVRADDHYLHDSILYSSKQVVAGYAPVMPSYLNFIPEPSVRKLIAFLKSLPGPASPPGPAAPP